MNKSSTLFTSELKAITLGASFIFGDLTQQEVDAIQLDWSPPANGNLKLLEMLDKLDHAEIKEKIEKANEEAITRIINSQPVLVGYDQAINAIPGMKKNLILHAGPPIEWDNMNGAMRGAVTGALVFEGLADSVDEAEKLAESGEIEFAPCHEYDAVGSMAGVTSASMYVHIVENKTYGNISYTNLSEQLSKILRFGANDQSVIDRLNWMRDVLGPMLRDAMRLNPEGIDLRLLLSQALHMGDECHNRNVAGTTLLIQALTPYIVMTDWSKEDQKDVFDFILSSDYFSGPTWMALCKCALDAAHGVQNSTIVTTMCRNGYEFGIRVSGLSKDDWFTGPAQEVVGPLFAGYKREDAGLDIGDSAITETYGIGGFAMATAPAIVPLVGGTVEEALSYSTEMLDITTTKNPNVTIPVLNFMGIPTGIDVRKVIEQNKLPIINTAIAHKKAGIGMIGAGITHPPFEAFEDALQKISEEYV